MYGLLLKLGYRSSAISFVLVSVVSEVSDLALQPLGPRACVFGKVFSPFYILGGWR